MNVAASRVSWLKGEATLRRSRRTQSGRPMILYTYSVAAQEPPPYHARSGTFFESLEEARQAVRILRNEVARDGAEWMPIRIETLEIPAIVTSRSLIRLLNEGIASFIQRSETTEIIS
ncbi:UNVERIFIED_ORG: hypothetical protein LHK14_23095 (plasmid) [Roseateles sp. XES5]|nr:hypothetical protein [Roseateles sp. XES5]